MPDPVLEALGAALLVGTERAPLLPRPELGSAWEAARERQSLDPDGQARALLDGLALAALRARAGSLPPLFEGTEALPAMSDAAEERDERPPMEGDGSRERPEAGPEASRLLGEIMPRPRAHALLPIWLGACRAAGRRAPASALPGLLDLAAEDPELRRPVGEVLGARGRWLAALEPRWSFAAEPSRTPPAGLHRTVVDPETGPARISALATLHRRDPGAGAAALAGAWSGLSAKDKVACVEALDPVHPADESALEVALDDRAKTVRRAAAEALARLPESALVRRAQDRLRDQLVMIGPGVLEIRAPAQLAPEVERDGIVRSPPSAPHGPRSSWVEQTIALVPPATHVARFGAGPADLLESARRGRSEVGIVLALTAATLRHPDRSWARALLDRGAPADRALLELLARDEREAILKQRMSGAGRPESLHRALALVAELSPPFSTSLARATLAALERLARAPRGRAFPIYGILRALALGSELEDERGPSFGSAFAAFGRAVPESSPWFGALEEAAALLRQRHVLARAFDETAPSERETSS